MSSLLLKSFTKKPSFLVHQGLVASYAKDSVQFRSYHNNSSEQNEDDRFFPVFVNPVSKVVLQHLQDARSGWLREQGLDRGLQIKANGTFVLKYPALKGSDRGKIWTSLDASTKQHWLFVYRQKFNGKYLLTQEEIGDVENLTAQEEKEISIENEATKKQIQSAVDQLVRVVPPSWHSTPKAAP